METKEIPILLLTGYLGSGKTTLLNYLLSNREGIKFAVIVNDIGEINIDAELIQKGGIVGQKRRESGGFAERLYLLYPPYRPYRTDIRADENAALRLHRHRSQRCL